METKNNINQVLIGKSKTIVNFGINNSDIQDTSRGFLNNQKNIELQSYNNNDKNEIKYRNLKIDNENTNDSMNNQTNISLNQNFQMNKKTQINNQNTGLKYKLNKSYTQAPAKTKFFQKIQKKNKEKINKNLFLYQQQFKNSKNKLLWLKMIIYTKTIMNYILFYSSSYKFKNLQEKHFNLISDPASNMDYYTFYNMLNNYQMNFIQRFNFKMRNPQLKGVLGKVLTENYFIKIFKIIFSSIKILSPDKIYRLSWDWFYTMILLINIYWIPIQISYQYDNEDLRGFKLTMFMAVVLEYIPGICYLIDILLNFNTGFYREGVLIKDRKQIFKNYVQTTFLIDFLVFIPFIISQFLKVEYLDIVLVLRIDKVFKSLEKLEEIMNFQGTKAAIYNFFKLALVILLCANFVACIFFYTSIFLKNQGYTDSWVDHFDIYKESFHVRYITSLYFAVITMITVGYGDLSPINIYERLIVIFLCLISCGLFAYTLNQIAGIFESLFKRDDEFKKEMTLLTNYMNTRKLNPQTQMRIRRYFQYLHNEKFEETEQSEKKLEQLTGQLLTDVKKEMYCKTFMQNQFWSNNFSESFLQEISLQMHEQKLGPDEFIFKQGDINDKIYYIFKGKAKSIINVANKEKILKVDDLDSFIGLQSFFSQQPCENSIKALNILTFVYFTRESFEEIIKKYPNDYQIYHQLKTQMTLLGKQEKCSICNKFSHSIQKCHMTNYYPYKTRVIKNSQISQNQTRDKQYYEDYCSTTIRKLSERDERNCLLNLAIIKEDLYDLQRVEEIKLQIQEQNNYYNQKNIDEYYQKQNEIQKFYDESKKYDTINREEQYDHFDEKKLPKIEEEVDDKYQFQKQISSQKVILDYNPKILKSLQTLPSNENLDYQKILGLKQDNIQMINQQNIANLIQNTQKNKKEREENKHINAFSYVQKPINYFTYPQMIDFETIKIYDNFFPNNNISDVFQKLFKHSSQISSYRLNNKNDNKRQKYIDRSKDYYRNQKGQYGQNSSIRSINNNSSAQQSQLRSKFKDKQQSFKSQLSTESDQQKQNQLK